MKLQDLTLQQLKEIVDGAPEGATHYDLETQQYLKTMCDGAYRFTQFNTWSHMSMSATDFIKADFCTIDAISKEFEARKDIIANLSAECIENKGVEASDTISVNLDPKKCRIVDPALPYDEPFVNPSLSDEPWQNVQPQTQLDNEAALFNELPIDAELKPDSKPEVGMREAFEESIEYKHQFNVTRFDAKRNRYIALDGDDVSLDAVMVLNAGWAAWQKQQVVIERLKADYRVANGIRQLQDEKVKPIQELINQLTKEVFEARHIAHGEKYPPDNFDENFPIQNTSDYFNGVDTGLCRAIELLKRLKGEQGE